MQIDISDPFLQDEITRLFSVYCIPECGDAINNANNDCGIYDNALKNSTLVYAEPIVMKKNATYCMTEQESY